MTIKLAMQAAFNKATTALINQGHRSFGIGPYNTHICMYRSSHTDGTTSKCAVGHLLSDEQMLKYNIREDTAAFDLPFDLIEELLPIEHHADEGNSDPRREFLTKLQSAHDGADGSNFVRSFVERANTVAEFFELVPINLDELPEA